MSTEIETIVQPVSLAQYGYSIVQIETKSICNMKCSFCAYPIRADKNEELSDKAVYKILDSLSNRDGFEHVCFSQFNEPLMDDRVFDFIAYAKARKLPVQLVSNGLLFKSDKKVEKLVKAAPDFVKISLQTVNDKLFKSARGINSSFEDYKQWIFKYLKHAANTSSHISVDVACNFLSGLRSVKTSLLGLDRGDPSVYARISDLKEDLELFLREWEEAYEPFTFNAGDYKKFLRDIDIYYGKQTSFPMADNIFLKIKHFMFGRKLTDFHPISFTEGCTNRIIGILASGKVVPCCLSYGELLDMGNIYKNSLSEILKQSEPLVRRIRTGTNLPQTCQRCLGAPTKRGVMFKELKYRVKKILT